jgi:hypothetical protein
MNTYDSIRPLIIQTMVMKLSERESLSYLQDKGFKIRFLTITDQKGKSKNQDLTVYC